MSPTDNKDQENVDFDSLSDPQKKKSRIQEKLERNKALREKRRAKALEKIQDKYGQENNSEIQQPDSSISESKSDVMKRSSSERSSNSKKAS